MNWPKKPWIILFSVYIPCVLMIYLTFENFRERLISRNTQFAIFFYPRFGKKKFVWKGNVFRTKFQNTDPHIIKFTIIIIIIIIFLQLYSLNITITKNAGAQAGFLKGDKTASHGIYVRLCDYYKLFLFHNNEGSYIHPSTPLLSYAPENVLFVRDKVPCYGKLQ